MEKRPFGKTDMQVSALGFGSYKMSSKAGGATVAEVGHLLGPALDAGMNVIDTAECYGQAEELIGQAVGHRRTDYYLFTKCGHTSGLDMPDWSPQLLERSIERSLQRLRTDHLDLVQLHSCSRDTLRQGEVIEVLQHARAAGKTRYIGYSGDRRAALYAVSCGAFDSLQISVNIADQESIDLTIPEARKQGMGVIAKRSVANGAWINQQEPSDPIDQIYWERLKALNYDFLQGDGLDENALHPYMWAMKPHYYNSKLSFYNYPYMFGLLFGLGLYARYKENAEEFKSNYDELLSRAGLADTATLAEQFGINIRSTDFWRSSLDIVRQDIERFEELTR